MKTNTASKPVVEAAVPAAFVPARPRRLTQAPLQRLALFMPLLAFAIGLSFAVTARAGSVVVGGSGILTQSGANQLASWLGEGDLTFTDIFSHISGDGKNSLDFHAAADGQGRTFSLLEVTNVNGTGTDLLVGGYNPHSWNSSNTVYYASSPSDFTAFLFNLSTGTLLSEKTDSFGQYQTSNISSNGPNFGGGGDLVVGWLAGSNTGSLDTGYANSYSYNGQLINGVPSTSLTYSKLDVFTVSTVPEPSAWAMLAVGTFALFVHTNRSKKAKP